MLQSLAFILYLLSAFLVVMMLFQYYRGTVDLLSLRNLYLGGFIIFQSNNAARVLWNEYFGEYPVVNLPGTPTIFVMMALMYIIIFLVTYQSGFLVSKFAATRAKAYRTPNVASMLTIAVVFAVLGVIFRMIFTKLPIPLFPQVFHPVGAGLLFVAAAIAGGAWAPRLTNPVIGGVSAGVILIAMVPILGDFSRRDILGLAMAFIWGCYHAHWRHLGPMQAMMRLGAVGAAGFILLSAHTAIRGAFIEKDLSFTQVIELMRGANVSSGASDLASGQDSGAISMWLIETRPEQFPYDTFHTARMLLTHPIPRMIYPDKPTALALTVPKQAGSNEQKAEAFNVGPGIIGHIANDNPWLALVPYAVFFGLFLRLLDDLVKWNAANPFVLLPIGVGLGNIIALARGETGHFLFMGMLNMLGAYIAMQVFVRTATTFGFVMRYDESQDQHDDDGGDDISADGEYAEDPYAQYSSYGDDQRAA